MKLQQRKRARKKYYKDEIKTKVVRIRVTLRDFKKIKKIAKIRKCTVSFFIEESLQKNWGKNES
jgi:transcriptional regulator with AAA-type ATPase domain